MTTIVEHADLELALCSYLRPKLQATWSAKVDRAFPATTWVPGFAVVVRDDSGPDLSLVTAQRNVGITIIGPQGSYQQTGQLAQRVAALLRVAADDPATPVAACVAVRGPYSLGATGRTEFYLTGDLVVVGHPVTI